MLRLTEVKLPLDHAGEAIEAAIKTRLNLVSNDLIRYTIVRRGFDLRRRPIAAVYTVDVEVADEAAAWSRVRGHRHVARAPDTQYRFVTRAPATLARRPLVIGLGPCGLFAGLVLAQMGFRPIILERGKAVRERTQDAWRLWRQSVLDPESNVQFGEGGAGTFSDGKLHSQIKDPSRRVHRLRFSTQRSRISGRFDWYRWSSVCGRR
jgi:uncharacterized protein